ncbi:MAG: zincin-like metallopeptidase domain-containing protein [Pseudomonadota bacterium]
MAARPTPRETAAARHHREVAEALLAMVRAALASGEEPPWRKPWVGGLGRHRTGCRRRKDGYRNWNAWSTFLVAALHGYRSERWYTAREGERQGWTLTPGAVAAPLIVPMPSGRSEGSSFQADWVSDWGTGEVYNRDAFVGPSPEPPPEPWDAARGVIRVGRLLAAVGLDLQLDGRACFNAMEDLVGLPAAHSFDGPHAWAATALHELVHWTGHSSRLARFGPSESTEDYALEELVAELGAATLASRLGVAGSRPDDEQHRAYMVGWARRIHADGDALAKALERAMAACRFLEALAPQVFGRDVEESAAVKPTDMPRSLHGGHLWRGDPLARLNRRDAVPAPPRAVIGSATAEVLGRWAQAVAAWSAQPRADAPTLVIAGFPGDGAETLLACLADWATGAADADPAPLPPPSGAWKVAWFDAHGRPGRRLPACALIPPTHQGQTEPEDPRPTTGSPEALAAALAAPRTFPVILVLRRPRLLAPEEAAPPLFIADLAREPLALELARWRLAKDDDRIWLAVQHRRPAATRLAESWSRRLRTGQLWLDGQEAPTRDPLQRLAFKRSAPFSPVVLQAAQAVLDALARRGLPAPGLPALVEEALRKETPQAAGQIIPLDALLAPVFRGALPAATAALRDRARFVVQLLELCPELSRGSRALVALLLRSQDEDLDALSAEIEQAATRRRPGERRSNRTRLSREGGSWSCGWPLDFGGHRLGREDR